MKKVTIPTCANPFVVIVNGIKYTYPAGETVEVPDDVAEVIEQHEETHNNPKPEPVVPPFAPTPSEVPSEGGAGGGGLEVIELTSTNVAQSAVYDEAENDALSTAWEKGRPIIIKCTLDLGTLVVHEFSGVAMRGYTLEGSTVIPIFAFSFGSLVVQLFNYGAATGAGMNVWSTTFQTV